MRMPRSFNIMALSLSIALSVSVVLPTALLAQAPGSAQVSVVTLQVLPGPNGAEQVVTPRGMVVPLPGAGVNSNVVQIYVGSQGGYWYVDRNGQTVDLTAAVQQLKARTGQAPYQTAQAPQYAPQPNVYINNEQPQSSSGGSSGSSGAGTALMSATAAGLGAMAGAAMTNDNYWHGVPYGTPMYYGAGARPYYVGANGNNVNVDATRNVNMSNSVSNSASTTNDIHANNLQKQQEWYNQQARSGSQQFKNWQGQTDNPFVRADAGQAGNFGGGAGAESGGRFGGRFGRGQNDGGGAQTGAFQGGGMQSGALQGQGGDGARSGGRFQNRGDGSGFGGRARGGGGLRGRGR